MKLIILYGAPAAGKLTVAKELSKITDVHVFDNHQVIDMVEPLVTRKCSDFTQLVYELQHKVMVAAAKANQVNLVFTFPYASNEKDDVQFLTNLINEAREAGADVYPILLQCTDETLRVRVTEPSRKDYGKVTSIETMNSLLKSYDFNTPLDVQGGHVLQTDELTAHEAAERIKETIFLSQSLQHPMSTRR